MNHIVKIKTLSTGKIKPGLNGVILGVNGSKPICPDGVRSEVALFDCAVEGHTWRNLELGRDFEIIR